MTPKPSAALKLAPPAAPVRHPAFVYFKCACCGTPTDLGAAAIDGAGRSICTSCWLRPFTLARN